MSFCVILLAAGNSKRFGSNLAKPYQKIGSKTLLELNIEKFSKFKQIKKIAVVHNKKHKKLIDQLNYKNVIFVEGGETRQVSTLNALKHINKKKNVDRVLIHDAARPNFSNKLINNIIKKSKKYKTVIPTLKIQDAIKQKYETNDYEYFVGRERKNLFLTQTPQCFNFKEILNLHKNYSNKYQDDDFSLLTDVSKVCFVEGEKSNFKITDKFDLINLKNIYKSKMSLGIGFDVHRLVPNRVLYLAGLKIKSNLGTLGHSDGDPVLHSITDAILGACKMGDIGQLFSDKNKKFKNVRSTVLLKEVLNRIKYKNYYINNLDINIIAQTPKIQKYKNKMINNISNLCEISKEKINIKGKTTEKLGVIGKEKAIACEVIISVIKYD